MWVRTGQARSAQATRFASLFSGLKQRKILINKQSKKLKVTKHEDLNLSLDSSNAQSYSVSSPFSLPPYESLAPIENSPPFCVNSPNPPSTNIPTPVGYKLPPPPPCYYTSPALPTLNPPSSPTGLIPGPPEPSPTTPTPTPTPDIVPNPPGITPGSPELGLNPPIIIPDLPGSTMRPRYYVASPLSNIPSPAGGIVPSPPSFVPSPMGGGGTVSSPIVFQPPVIFPPPNVPPLPNVGPSVALWCVAKPSLPDPIMQEAINYACGSGGDCDSISPMGLALSPTQFAHASYAFNSYWQRTTVAGGTCEFGGTVMLVTVGPSYDGCHFVYV